MLPAQTPMPILGPGEIPPILSVPAACIAGFPIPIDPATNDAPLEFNTIRSQPPIVIELDNEDSIACLEQSSKQEDRCTRDWSPERERGYRDREKRDRDRFRERIGMYLQHDSPPHPDLALELSVQSDTYLSIPRSK